MRRRAHMATTARGFTFAETLAAMAFVAIVMPAITHVFWRDIQAQVIVGKGRAAAKAPLPERFEQAIDRAAMKIGAKEEDAYLAEWRRVVVGETDGDIKDVATSEAAAIDAAYDNARLKTLIDAEGHDPAKSA